MAKNQILNKTFAVYNSKATLKYNYAHLESSISAEKLPSVHAIVKGRVQGVGFRHFVRQRAQALRVVGWVRNLGDGNVEFVAEAKQQALENLISAVRDGPRESDVTDIELKWGHSAERFKDFVIKPMA